MMEEGKAESGLKPEKTSSGTGLQKQSADPYWIPWRDLKQTASAGTTITKSTSPGWPSKEEETPSSALKVGGM